MRPASQSRFVFLAIVAFTFGSHCVFGWKIWQKKRTLYYLGSGHSSVFLLCYHSPTVNQQNVTNKTGNTHILDNCSSVMFFTLVLLPMSILFGSVILFGGLHKFLALRVSLLSAFLLIVPLSVYVRKPHVRTTLARELKNMF